MEEEYIIDNNTQCDKEHCTNNVIAVLTILTDEGPVSVCSCVGHLTTFSDIIGSLQDSIINREFFGEDGE